MTDPNATQSAFAYGILGGILTLGARSQLSGLIPRLAVESSAYGKGTRVKAGFELVPPFMRSLVQRVLHSGRACPRAAALTRVPATQRQIQREPRRFLDRAILPQKYRRRRARRSDHAQLGHRRHVGTMSDAGPAPRMRAVPR